MCFCHVSCEHHKSPRYLLEHTSASPAGQYASIFSTDKCINATAPPTVAHLQTPDAEAPEGLSTRSREVELDGSCKSVVSVVLGDRASHSPKRRSVHVVDLVGSVHGLQVEGRMIGLFE